MISCREKSVGWLIFHNSKTARKPHLNSVLSRQKVLLINDYPANAKHSEAAPEWYGFCGTLTCKCRPSQGPLTASASFTPALDGSSRWRSDMVNPAKNTICLWYDGDAED